MKDFEAGKKCLSAQIFRKSKGPIILSAPNTILLNSTVAVDGATFKGIQTNGKRTDTPANIKDITLADFDIN
jgi:hypothetical protein